MEFKELAYKRHSVRKYSGKPVAIEDVKEILETAALSPSACNSQPWKFVVVREDKASELAEYVTSKVLPINKWAKDVSTFVVICETKAKLMKKLPVSSQHYAQIDIGIVTSTLCYAAEDKGISSCIMGAFDEKKVKKLLGIPKNIKVRLIIALGYSAEEKAREKSRKDYDEIISINKW